MGAGTNRRRLRVVSDEQVQAIHDLILFADRMQARVPSNRRLSANLSTGRITDVSTELAEIIEPIADLAGVERKVARDD